MARSTTRVVEAIGAHDAAAGVSPVPFISSRAFLERFLLVAVILAAAALGFTGIKKNLPYAPEVDEDAFTEIAVDMSAHADPNPGWFGHPGSTVIYPLAGVYTAWHAVTGDGDIIPPSDIGSDYEADIDDYYYIGRALNVLYFVGTVFVTYLMGKRLFGTSVGLLAALFLAVSPVIIEYSQLVRTDMSAAFFGMLSLWLILRLHDRPSMQNRLLAGAAVGLAISSRYFMACIVPVLALAEISIFLRNGVRPDFPSIRDAVTPFAGLAAAVAVFAITTPFFFLDFSTAIDDIRSENRLHHLGADGLSKRENFLWYLTDAIPGAMGVPIALLALAGAGIVLFKRQRGQLLCLAMLGLILVAISYPHLHWQRWVIPALPIVGILAAVAVYESVESLRKRLRLPPAGAAGAIAAVAAIAIAWPAVDTVLHDLRAVTPTTNVQAREWLVENLPPGSRIATEQYTAPMRGTDFEYTHFFALFSANILRDYREQGIEYVLTSSNIYDRYYAEPEVYGAVVERYESLFVTTLLAEFSPGDARGGPTIRVYDIRPLD